ncbi:MAG TPA: ROK family protein [Actinomycetota bacterium]|nr:ROK family protein [Actinomycetota bacterium]
MNVLAFDLGGTRLKGGVVSVEDGLVAMTATVEIEQSFEMALEELVYTARMITESYECSSVGLCVPGLVNEEGVVLSLPGKLEGIEGFDLKGFLRRELSLEPFVVNDAVAYGSGEAAFGAGRDYRIVVVMTIGTGVGVTILENGVPLTDGVFGAGILGGQIPISEATSGPEDTSGRPDTIEAFCRADRIVDYSGTAFKTVPDVFEAFARGDLEAVKGVETYRSHLARALVALAHAHTPEAIVIGGGPMVAGTPLLEGVEETVNSRLFGTYRVVVRPAQLGDNAALAGLARIGTR